jgi:hypothetical protein
MAPTAIFSNSIQQTKPLKVISVGGFIANTWGSLFAIVRNCCYVIDVLLEVIEKCVCVYVSIVKLLEE